jgi:AraC-like DNA-binding protein
MLKSGHRRTMARHIRAQEIEGVARPVVAVGNDCPAGLTVATWQRRACVLAALPRLLAGGPVTTIAFDLGYASPAGFTTMSKRLVGAAPNAYRERAARRASAGDR